MKSYDDLTLPLAKPILVRQNGEIKYPCDFFNPWNVCNLDSNVGADISDIVVSEDEEELDENE